MRPDPRPAALIVSSVLPYPPLGGGEKRTLRLLDAIARSGARPELIVGGAADPGATAALRNRGVGVEVVAAPHPSLARRTGQHLARRPSPYLPEMARALEARLARDRAAFVQIEHTQNSYYLPLVDGIPTVLSLHNVDSDLVATLAAEARAGSVGWLRLWNRWHSMRTTERRAARRADLVVCVSRSDLESFAGRAADGVVVPNGVDDELFEIGPPPADSQTVLFVGRYDYEPNAIGVERFLREGWPELAARRPEARLRLVGPEMSEGLRAAAGASERVEAAGAVESIAAELAEAAVVVVPIWQGAGTRLKVLEAMAAARPVAGTPLGVSGIGFADRRHGILAADAAGIADAAATLLGDRELAGHLGAGGRELAERFRWPAATEPLERRYRGWVAAAG